MNILTEPVVHYVRHSGSPCRNAIVTEGTGDKLSLAVFEPEGLRFASMAYHALPPDPGGGTWHHLAECMPSPSRTLRDRITDELISAGARGYDLNTGQLAEFVNQDSDPVTDSKVRRELHRMRAEGLAEPRCEGTPEMIRWRLTPAAAKPSRTLRDRITDALRAGPPTGWDTGSLTRYLSESSPVTHDEIRRELHRMRDEGLAEFMETGPGPAALWVLTPAVTAPACPLLWHKGTHAWSDHDGYRWHEHSPSGELTIGRYGPDRVLYPGDRREEGS